MLLDTDLDTAVPFLLTNGGSPVQADALPTFRVLGTDGEVASGTASQTESGTVTGCTAATPAVVTSAAHGLSTGAVVTTASIGGVTGVNGTYSVTVLSANTFSLDGTTGGGSYTSGGTWKTTGLYRLGLTAPQIAALEPGRTYIVTVYGAISGVKFARDLTFTVA